MRVFLWLWSAWAVYWMLCAVRNKPTQRREPFGSRLAHTLPLAIGAFLIASPAPGWSALAQRLWPPSPIAYWTGATLFIAGLVFAVWARVHLGSNWSGTVTVKQGHELIRSGPYAWVRHPIYTGLITAVFGTAVASGTMPAAVGLAIVTASLVRKSRVEEEFMRNTFPDEYPRYSAEVPALIPF